VGSDASKASHDENVGNSDGAEDSDGSNVFDDYTHKKSLENLRDTDPEFYKYLEQNDRKLLQFSVSDSEDEADEEQEDQVHKPVQDLEVS
jgi:nucleolar complex protein 2